MRRYVFLLIAVLMLFSVACAESQSESESFDESFGNISDTVDLNGFDFKIRYYEYYSLGSESVLSYEKDSTFYDAAIERINTVEKSYNCRITTENAGDGGLESSFTPTVMAGLYFSDAVLLGWYDLRPYVEGNMFEPISEVSDIIDYNNSTKWGTPNYLEWVVWDGNLYGVMPVLWPEYYLTSFGHMFVFNEQFAQRQGQPDPREYIDDGTWSRETLGDMMTTYTFNDGTKDIKALCQYPGHFIDQALRSNNAQAYKYDNGRYVSGYHTPEGQNALDWAAQFLNVTYQDCIIPHTSDEGNYNHLINGDCAMVLTYTAYIYGSRASLSYELEDYCVLPFPNGPDRSADEGYIGTFESVRNTLMFPLNGNDFTSSAYICDALFEQLGDYDTENLKDFYLRFYFHDERDYNIFFEVAKNTRYSYYADGFRPKVTETIANGKTDVAQILESTEDFYNELVAEKVVPTITSMSEIFTDYVN